MKGYFLFGQNPAGGGMNAGLQRAGLRKPRLARRGRLVRDRERRLLEGRPDRPAPEQVKTEVFFIPAAGGPEKEGCLTNTQRLIQWHNKAIDPPGDCRSDAWFVYHLGKRLKTLYADSTDPRDEPIRNLTWDYDATRAGRTCPTASTSRIAGEPDITSILKEINGYKLDETDPKTGGPRQLRGFSELKDDGTTACGCWIYSGVFPEAGRNRASDRKLGDNPLQPEWGFAWPHNRRVMYNRASADPEGRPWSERKKLIWWDAEKRPLGRRRRAGLRAGQAARLPTGRTTPRAWTRSPATTRSS